MKKKGLLLLLLFVLWGVSYAQQYSVTGKVTSAEDGNSLPGVSIAVKGTTTGTITDIDGNYALNIKDRNATLVFAFVGMKSQEIPVNGKSRIDVSLSPDILGVDEVVVVGYGVQKKSVVTASIAQVNSDDLKNVSSVRIDNALKGLASGVTVTSSSGQPGAASQIRIRGVGTINNSDPLYIVDGMPIDGGIDYLNPADIMSVEILKDAASGAVYGARAANGVILVTTKSGSKEKVKVSYDFSHGYQSPWRKRDVLNATEYAVMMNEAYLISGKAAPYSDPYSYGEGTDWQDQVFYNNAPETNHQLSISGGSDKVSYYISAGYFKQDGIVGGNWDRSNYERISIRSNTTYNLLNVTDRNYLNKFNAGVNVAYTRTNSRGISTNSEYGSILGSAVAFSPLLGIYEKDQAAALATYPNALRDPKNDSIYTIAGANYNEITNPLAQLSLPGEKNNSDKFVSNFWGELTLWDNLKFKSSFGTDLSFWGADGWTPKYYLGQSNHAEESKVWSSMNRAFVWQVENVLSYEKSFWEKHNIQAIIGQSAKKTVGRSLGGSNKYMVEENGEKANIDFTTGTAKHGDQSVSGSAYSPRTLASLFARLSYNYGEKYMLQATVRRDGSSNFGPGKRYGIFPSVSLGWNITSESFMEKRPDWFSTMKLRASWGKNGNENIDAFGYVALTSSGNNYTFGSGNGTIYNGTKPSGLINQNLHWEESAQTDVGLDFGFFNRSLTFTVDYYDKETNGMLMTMMVPSYVGDSKPTGNVGDMKNSGVEFEAAYKLKIKDFNLRISGNASYLKNELINLGNSDGFKNLDYYQNVGTITRAENGNPFPFFYGLKTDGIFQSLDEVKAYTKEGTMIQPKAVAGDVRFVDLNNDGLISDLDKTMIGKGMPDWTYGMNINAEWKGFDLSIMLQGTVGNDIYDATRRTDIAYINLPSYMLNRWTGPGTSNKLPRFTFTDANSNWLSSDLFVKDGDYMRVKNVVLGYTLPSKLTRKAFISSLRLYVSAENLLTFTTYEGFDPEISSGGTSLGIDRGVYPQARTYTFGVNLSF
ncbi:MAG TPA: TonB-dependent receptor [Prolixibacteraceae bacterium]|mgnify:CR=1 FL=1|nr:TonB-dependent receptor [Prolixibacteraceae bacterium]HPS11787.1 TonB-dependent receptor [Prolixibacteraceae bacterium]